MQEGANVTGSEASDSADKVVRSKTAQAILSAAIELLATQGYYGTSMREIARQAGVSTGLTYNYFASKEILFEAAFAEVREEFTALINYLDSSQKDKKNILFEFLQDFLISLQQKPLLWQMFHQVRSHAQTRELVAQEYAQLIEAIEHGLRFLLRSLGYKAKNDTVQMFFAMLDGTSAQILYHPNPQPKSLASKIYHIFARR